MFVHTHTEKPWCAQSASHSPHSHRFLKPMNGESPVQCSSDKCEQYNFNLGSQRCKIMFVKISSCFQAAGWKPPVLATNCAHIVYYAQCMHKLIYGIMSHNQETLQAKVHMSNSRLNSYWSYWPHNLHGEKLNSYHKHGAHTVQWEYSIILFCFEVGLKKQLYGEDASQGWDCKRQGWKLWWQGWWS